MTLSDSKTAQRHTFVSHSSSMGVGGVGAGPQIVLLTPFPPHDVVCIHQTEWGCQQMAIGACACSVRTHSMGCDGG